MPRPQNDKAIKLESILSHQREWASGKSLQPGFPNYLKDRSDNLFAKLSESAEKSYGKGSGKEFEPRVSGDTGQELPAKFNALKSSSVLACNVFDFWTGNGEQVVLDALGGQPHIADGKPMEFEAQYHNGVRGGLCNLDLALTTKCGWVIAVEAKFTEPLESKEPLRPAYTPKLPAPTPWKREGLNGCDGLARECSDYEYLDVPQLLKHILGLHRTRRKQFPNRPSVRDRYRLVYLYFDFGGAIGNNHIEEIERFRSAVYEDIDFESFTYQTLVKNLKKLSNGSNQEYFNYLEQRYQLG